MSTSEESGTESEESSEETKVPVLVKKDLSCTVSSSGSEDESSDAKSDAPAVSKSVRANVSKSVSGRALDDDRRGKQSEADRSSDTSDAESSSSVKSNKKDESDVSTSDSGAEISGHRASPRGPSRKKEKAASSSEKDSGSSGEESSTESGQGHSNVKGGLRKQTKSTDNSNTSDSDTKGSVATELRVKVEPLESEDEVTDTEETEIGTFLLHPDNALISPSSGVISLENLPSSSDLWVIHCPDTISESDLQGAKLDFDSDTHIKFGGRRFHATPYPENGTVACVLPSHVTKKYFVAGLPLKGCLVFEETIKLPKPQDLDKNSEVGVKFPTNLKERHPLFGADYQERLKKGLEVKKLLKRADKRRSKSRESTGHKEDSFSVEKTHSSSVKKDRTKKKENSDHSENNSQQHELWFIDYGNSVNDISVSPKKKKRKRDRESESGGAPQANGFDELSTVEKKRKIDTERSMDAQQSPNENPAPQKKHKSKRRSGEVDISEDFLKKIREIKKEPGDEPGQNEETPRKKKKIKEKSN